MDAAIEMLWTARQDGVFAGRCLTTADIRELGDAIKVLEAAKGCDAPGWLLAALGVIVQEKYGNQGTEIWSSIRALLESLPVPK